MKTLIVGLGNPILGDDGVGWKVADQVRQELARGAAALQEQAGDVDVEFLSLGGLSLMEHLIGYDRVILIDALRAQEEPGCVVVAKLSEMPDYSAFHVASAHDTSLQNALKLGRLMGARLPENVTVVGISTRPSYEFGEELSAPVAASVARAARIVMGLL